MRVMLVFVAGWNVKLQPIKVTAEGDSPYALNLINEFALF